LTVDFSFYKIRYMPLLGISYLLTLMKSRHHQIIPKVASFLSGAPLIHNLCNVLDYQSPNGMLRQTIHNYNQFKIKQYMILYQDQMENVFYFKFCSYSCLNI
jgi:hypothetical protein